tara:strand:- start:714 stop:827 length:114 start_codon:yes stop_codon:yes gene_type:complete
MKDDKNLEFKQNEVGGVRNKYEKSVVGNLSQSSISEN